MKICPPFAWPLPFLSQDTAEGKHRISMHKGSLALLLHAHLPWVRHPEHDEFFEEDWLYEAITETYIPLLKIFRRLAFEKVAVKVTFTMTPTLCAMLRDRPMPVVPSRPSPSRRNG